MDLENKLLLTNQQPHKLWIFWFTAMYMPPFLVFLTTSIILLCVWMRFRILSLILQVFWMKWFDCRYEQANSIVSLHESIMLDWLIVLGLSALWDSISVYIRPSPREMEKEKILRNLIDERKNVQTTPTCTYCKRSRTLPFPNPNL